MNKIATPEYILEIRKNKYSPEIAAMKVLEKCEIDRFPINVWAIARKLNFQVLEARFNDKCVSGMMIDALEVPKQLKDFSCKRAIILNSDEEKNVQSFTVAHELAHFIYDCNENENYFNATHKRKKKTYKDMTKEEQKEVDLEDERDLFAANLLMPKELFTRYVETSSNRYNKEILKMEMSKVCMVQEVAIEKRFEELNIQF